MQVFSLDDTLHEMSKKFSVKIKLSADSAQRGLIIGLRTRKKKNKKKNLKYIVECLVLIPPYFLFFYLFLLCFDFYIFFVRLCKKYETKSFYTYIFSVSIDKI